MAGRVGMITTALTILLSFGAGIDKTQACTTLVASGRATVDGRPLLWKNRDYWQRHNELIRDDSGKYTLIGITNAGAFRSIRMGVNTAGLCIENSTSRDLTGEVTTGPLNGQLIRMGLQTCATVQEFEELLKSTNATGRRTRGNFGVIDAHGGAMMFEVGPNYYRAFDANDPEDAPLGFIVRSNFSETARNQKPEADRAIESLYSSERYLRAYQLCESRLATSKLDLKFILHEVCRDIDGPAVCDFGCPLQPAADEVPAFETSSTLNRSMTVSAVVFQGVKPGESPTKTTMWSILGEPFFSVAIPAWAAQDKVASCLDGPVSSSLCDLSLQLRQANYEPDGKRILTSNLPPIADQIRELENELIDETDRALQTSGFDPVKLHTKAANAATQLLTDLTQSLANTNSQSANARNQPDPHIDFRFEDKNGTRLTSTLDTAGASSWDGGMTDCTVWNGSFRIRRNDVNPVTRYLELTPRIRTTFNDARDPKVDRAWLVIEVAGWNFQGATPNEVVRLGFTSQPDKDIHTVGLAIERTDRDAVSVSGVAFGEGGSPINSSLKWPAVQSEPVTFALELDKARGNPDEGETGGMYRIFYRKAGDKEFTPIGEAGTVRRLRNGNAMHFRTSGFFGFDNEYFDIDRIYYCHPLQ